jgi:hypothetical protein
MAATHTNAPHRPKAPRLTITVDPNIAKEAIARDSGHCMWAEAVKKAVPTAQHVSVDLQTIRFTDPEKKLRYTYLTPRATQIALINFDRGVHIDQPMSVRLRSGQVTTANSYDKNRRKRDTPPMPDQTTLVVRQAHAVPDVVGGTTPPTGALTNASYKGKRRAFGLRGLTL